MKYSPVTPALRALTALVVILLAPRAIAQDGTWISTSYDGYWSDSSNWVGNTVADGANHTATFNSEGDDEITVDVDASRTIGHLIFSNSGYGGFRLISYGGNHVLTLAGDAPSITVNNRMRLPIEVVIAGDSGLIKAGDGRLDLYASNTYTGGTIISDGEVLLRNIAGLGSGNVVVAAGAQLTFDVPGTFTNNLTFGNNALLASTSGGMSYVTGDITLTGDLRLQTFSNSHLIFSGTISGDFALKTISPDAGSITFAGTAANTYTGSTTIDHGMLILAKTEGVTAVSGDLISSQSVRFDASHQIADTSAVTLNDSGTLNLNGQTETIGSLASSSGSSSVTLGTGGALTVGAANTSTTFAGVISGAGTLTKIGTGNFTLSGANTFTGGTTLNAGTLTLGSANALLNATGKLLVTGGSLNTSVANTTVGGDIEFTGGTLSINGADAGALTLAEGKNFTMSDGTIEFTLGTSFDQIISLGDGALSLTGSTINLTLGDGFDYYSYYALFSNFTTAHFNALTITGYDTLNYVASISNMGVLSFSASAVPKPSTYALLAGLGVLGIAMWRRRAVR